jgi:hypothetical protein
MGLSMDRPAAYLWALCRVRKFKAEALSRAVPEPGTSRLSFGSVAMADPSGHHLQIRRWFAVRSSQLSFAGWW